MRLLFNLSLASSPYLISAGVFFMAQTGQAQHLSTRQVEFYSASGYRVAGVHYFSPDGCGPGLLLVHDVGKDHTAWDKFLPILEKAGLKSILAVDLRGHGQSDSRLNSESGPAESEKVNWREFSEADFKNVPDDFEVAWDYLKRSPATDTSRMAVMGSTTGANYAAVFASGRAEVKSLVLLSPGVVYRGIDCQKAVERYGRRAILLAASKGDLYSTGSCVKLKGESAGTPAHLEILDGSRRGVGLIDDNPGFKHFLSDWFRSTL